MSDLKRVIGDKIVRKDPLKSSKNYRCKINAAKLRQKHVAKEGIDGLINYNREKRAKSDAKKGKEVDAIRVERLKGDHAKHKTLRGVQEELATLKKSLEEKTSELAVERSIRKEYQVELGKSQQKVEDLKDELKKSKAEKDTLWALIRQQKTKLNSLNVPR